MNQDLLTRRAALKTMGASAALLGVGAFPGDATAAAGSTPQPFKLPVLGYSYGALEPHIDARTMEIHHQKHHQAYIDNANKALAEHPGLQRQPAEDLLRHPDTLPAAVRAAVRNNVGGHVNHAFFWRVIGPNGGGVPSGALAEAIAKKFGSFAAFQAEFSDAAMKRFGSGWAWLVRDGGALAVESTPNQDSPISRGAVPLLGLDVWEHAYYLKFQNRRADYVKAFWNVVDWREVGTRFASGR